MILHSFLKYYLQEPAPTRGGNEILGGSQQPPLKVTAGDVHDLRCLESRNSEPILSMTLPRVVRRSSMTQMVAISEKFCHVTQDNSPNVVDKTFECMQLPTFLISNLWVFLGCPEEHKCVPRTSCPRTSFH